MSRHWDGLVLGDYEAVFPLTWNKKWGIHYLYQPAFAASLGIFGKDISTKIIQQFLQAIPSKFKLVEIDLNRNDVWENNASLTIGEKRLVASEFFLRSNFVLDLNTGYEHLYNNYRDNIKRNIKKSQQLNCRYETGIPVSDVLHLSRQQMQKVSNLSAADYDNFQQLFNYLLERKQALTCGVYTAANELVASCVYFFSHNRAYYILVGNHPNGKTIGASHYLIDRFIHAHAGQPLFLDFEGSDIRNLAFFYSSFGATNEVYPALRVNRLPWWLKAITRIRANYTNYAAGSVAF